MNFDEEVTDEEEEEEEAGKLSGSHPPCLESERPSSATSQMSAIVSMKTLSFLSKKSACAF